MKELVDPDTYLKILVFLAGKTIYFPVTENKDQRNREIREGFWKEGLTVAELVKAYGLSESQIRRIIKKG